jgi:hypothetical protein
VTLFDPIGKAVPTLSTDGQSAYSKCFQMLYANYKITVSFHVLVNAVCLTQTQPADFHLRKTAANIPVTHQKVFLTYKKVK